VVVDVPSRKEDRPAASIPQDAQAAVLLEMSGPSSFHLPRAHQNELLRMKHPEQAACES